MNEKFTSIQKVAPGRICHDPGFPPVRGAPQPQNTGQYAGFGGQLHIKETRHRQCFMLHMRDGPPMAFIARGSVFAAVEEIRVFTAKTQRKKKEEFTAETRRRGERKKKEVFTAKTRRRREKT